jgi:hypothetical protein
MRVQTKKIKIDMTISIAKDFSRWPGARYPEETDYCGEDFRRRILYPKFCEARSRGEKLEVNFDGLYGLSSAFLDEAFAGLIIDEHESYEDVKKYISVTGENVMLIDLELNMYLDEAKELQRKALS